MVDYVSTNALSMLGGDDYSDITASLVNFVTLNTAQTILSGANKTHQEINTFNNETNLTGPLYVYCPSVEINSGGTFDLIAVGTNMNITAIDPSLIGTEGSIAIQADQDINITRTSNNGLSGNINLTSNGNIAISTLDPLAIGVGTIDIVATDNLVLTSTLGDMLLTCAGSMILGATSSGSQMRFQVNGSVKFDILNTTTAITNPTITNLATTAYKVQNVSGTDKLNIAPTLTKNTNATITEVATTAYKVQNVDGTDKLNIAPTLTKNTNATITEVATTAYKVQNVDGTDKLNIAPTLTTNTNATITEVATTAYKVQNVAGTDKLTIEAATTTNSNQYQIVNAPSGDITLTTTDPFGFGSTGRIIQNSKFQLISQVDSVNTSLSTTTLTTNTNATITDVATTRNFQVVAGTNIATITASVLSCNQNMTARKYLSTDGDTIISCESGSLNASIPYVSVKKFSTAVNAYAAQYKTNSLVSVVTVGGVDTTASVMDWTVVTLNSNLATQNFIASTVFNVTDGTNNKVAITPTLTTLTNTNVDIVAPLHATSYAVGTTASSVPLCTYQTHVGRALSNQGISTTNYLMNFGSNISTANTTTSLRPFCRLVPKFCSVFFDSGTFTGGGTTTFRINFLDNTSTLCYQSPSTAFNSASTSIASLAMTEILALVSGAAYQIQIAVSNTVAITLSTKNVYCIIHSQQF